MQRGPAARPLNCPRGLPSHCPGPCSVVQRPGQTPLGGKSRGGSWDASQAPLPSPRAASPRLRLPPCVAAQAPAGLGGAPGRSAPRSLWHAWNGA